jgi:hypothetical protein
MSSVTSTYTNTKEILCSIFFLDPIRRCVKFQTVVKSGTGYNTVKINDSDRERRIHKELEVYTSSYCPEFYFASQLK